MTNEEKVKELAIHYTQYDSDEDVNIVDAFGALREMAEWKDNQFKEYLEKKREENHPYWNGYECLGAESIINEIINELFGN